MKFNECLKQFCAWKKYDIKLNSVKNFENYLMSFGLFYRNPEVETLDWGSIQEYLKMRETMGWDVNGFRGICAALKSFFDYCKMMKMQTLDPDLIPLPERTYKQVEAMTDDEFEAVLKTFPDSVQGIRARAFWLLLGDTGMRIGECLSLDFPELDFTNMCAMIKTEKTTALHPIRKVFWTTRTNDALLKWTALRGKNAPLPLFYSTSGPKAYSRIVQCSITSYVKKCCERGGVQFKHCHTIRHRFGVNIVKAGANTHTVMNLMGHANLNSSIPYTILAGDEMAGEYNKLFKR